MSSFRLRTGLNGNGAIDRLDDFELWRPLFGFCSHRLCLHRIRAGTKGISVRVELYQTIDLDVECCSDHDKATSET